MTDPTRPPAASAPHDHLVTEGRTAVVVRWLLVALGGYNALVALVDGAWVRGTVWAVVVAALLGARAARRRVGTRVGPDGLRAGSGWRWGPLVRWEDVVAVHVAGPYEARSRVQVRGRRDLLLRGMAPDAVRALLSERGLVAHDRVQDRARLLRVRPEEALVAPDPAVEPAADGAMDGPFRSARGRARPPGG